jgi:hypothetical protein
MARNVVPGRFDLRQHPPFGLQRENALATQLLNGGWPTVLPRASACSKPSFVR